MADFPATQNTGNLTKFIGDIGGIGIPDKLTTANLASYGYTSSHDRSIVSVLKGIDLIDDSSKPTDLWRTARTSPKKAVAQGLLAGYTSLYQHYPNAHDKDLETLINFFKSKTDVGDSTVRKIASTFKTLADYADFTDVSDVEQATGDAEKPKEQAIHRVVKSGSSTGMTINLNIELSLPPDAEGKVYDAFFKSMKKHLIDDAA